MTSTAWNGYANGAIPLAKMSVVRGQHFEPQAAKQLVKLEAAFTKKFKKPAVIIEGYRSLATQEILWHGWLAGLPGYNPANYPGTSNHGFGRAADFASSIDLFGSPEHKWMVANAPTYGWHWGEAPTEAWHFTYYPGTATASTTSKPVNTDIQKEIVDMATGVCYKQTDQDTVYWQEKPNTPVVPLSAGTWTALKANGMVLRVLAAVDMKPILAFGVASRPQGNSAQGVAYRQSSNGSVFWQKEPGTPLIGLTPIQWAALKQNGLVYVECTDAELAPLRKIV